LPRLTRLRFGDGLGLGRCLLGLRLLRLVGLPLTSALGALLRSLPLPGGLLLGRGLLTLGLLLGGLALPRGPALGRLLLTGDPFGIALLPPRPTSRRNPLQESRLLIDLVLVRGPLLGGSGFCRLLGFLRVLGLGFSRLRFRHLLRRRGLAASIG
jgi:hypothetical protein